MFLTQVLVECQNGLQHQKTELKDKICHKLIYNKPGLSACMRTDVVYK